LYFNFVFFGARLTNKYDDDDDDDDVYQSKFANLVSTYIDSC